VATAAVVAAAAQELAVGLERALLLVVVGAEGEVQLIYQGTKVEEERYVMVVEIQQNKCHKHLDSASHYVGWVEKHASQVYHQEQMFEIED